VVRGDRNDFIQRRSIMLDKLDAVGLFLPEFDMPVDRGCDYELSPALDVENQSGFNDSKSREFHTWS
jgi:hypothetical protein